MLDYAVAARAATLLALVLIPGWAVARSLARRSDSFAIVCFGVAVTSMTGVVLARSAFFSLGTLALANAVVSALALAAAGGRGGAAPVAARSGARVRALAFACGASACLWAWPPYETFLAAADSTMYVDAGVHLARTGSLEVPDTVVRILPRSLAASLFPSVGVFGHGPYIRLPGGLLMASLDAASVTPAFFPLLSVWTAALAAVGGPAAAPAVAPLGLGLGVWAVTLFAGELFGLAAVVPTAVVLIGNFALWWFGKFPMSEPLTMAFVWGALVFLGRGAPLAAGVLLGLGGLARAETLLFSLAALAWWMLWIPIGAREAGRLAAGFVLAGGFAAAALATAPSHHFAYLGNDLIFARASASFRSYPALVDGRLVAGGLLVPVLPLVAAAIATWRGGSLAINVLRSLTAFGTLAAVALYFRIGGVGEPARHLGWLATSMSTPGLLFALVGGAVVWKRGNPAARLAVILVLLVAVVFVPNPRVAPYQPWAMRRFLPVLLPGLAVAVGAVAAVLLGARRTAWRVLAVVLLATVLALQLPSTWVARRHDYFEGSLAGARRVAEIVPPDAVVVVDSSFADVQLQVPLWLVFGRETVMTSGGGSLWRELLTRLTTSGRSVYWVQNRFSPAPQGRGLVLTLLEPVADLTIDLPDAPTDAPPSVVVRKLVPLAVYGVAPGDGPPRQFSAIFGSRSSRCTKFSGVVTRRPSVTRAVSPLASLPSTTASTRPSFV